MATFREFSHYTRDRSIEDRKRHRELIESSIKDNISNLISEKSIIKNVDNKVVKIPLKGLKEYYFKFGKNEEGVCSLMDEVKKGDKILISDDTLMGASDEEGVDIYESEITLDEAINILFEDCNLPNLRNKKYTEIELDAGFKKKGIVRKGIYPRLAKKHMLKIKRRNRPFRNTDIRYYNKKTRKIRHSNAVIICIMDTSGSMGHTKKYLARSFYFLLYQFSMNSYPNNLKNS
ncbi:MAG: hypothetical protein BEN19_06385 [Epulopiscium sp. Nuni2H_MBin003]|nr:MAG: hypothetical protein BEN19_06385 [Epulopiscium sp. Nuni2H_MBin003]